MQIEGIVAIITGASEGIGAACAAELARYGVRLSLTARSEEALHKAAPGALVTPGDITREDTRRAVVERTLEHYGAIDLLVNCAGAGLYLPSWEAPMEEARRLMELNFFALLGMTQLVAPHMRERRRGCIVNVGSIAGKVTLPWLTLYSASKSAVGALTEGLRMELRRDGVRTMLVCPGYVKTNFQRNALAGRPPAGIVQGRVFAIDAAQCAKAIRRGLERDARTIVTPRACWILAALASVFPALLEERLAKLNGTA
ncbi:MAG: SDR family NAD(P)-dependent oxidoreductase [Bryobacteraceae bacterium]|jgi:short-subunit dehydrogenase